MAVEVTITFKTLPGCKPTIYDQLKEKLGREPSNAELKADVERILSAVSEMRETVQRHAENEP